MMRQWRSMLSCNFLFKFNYLLIKQLSVDMSVFGGLAYMNFPLKLNLQSLYIVDTTCLGDLP